MNVYNIAPLAMNLYESQEHGDNLYTINDGVTRGGLTKNRWTNWNDGVVSEGGYVELEWDDTYYIDHVGLHLYTDRNVDVPSDITLVYLNPNTNEYEEVKNVSYNALNRSYFKENIVYFDPITTSNLRIVLHANKDKFIGLTEVNVYGCLNHIEQSFVNDTEEVVDVNEEEEVIEEEVIDDSTNNEEVIEEIVEEPIEHNEEEIIEENDDIDIVEEIDQEQQSEEVDEDQVEEVKETSIDEVDQNDEVTEETNA